MSFWVWVTSLLNQMAKSNDADVVKGSLLVGLQNVIISRGIIVEVPSKAENWCTMKSSYNVLALVLKGLYSMLHRCMLIHVHTYTVTYIFMLMIMKLYTLQQASHITIKELVSRNPSRMFFLEYTLSGFLTCSNNQAFILYLIRVDMSCLDTLELLLFIIDKCLLFWSCSRPEYTSALNLSTKGRNDYFMPREWKILAGRIIKHTTVFYSLIFHK